VIVKNGHRDFEGFTHLVLPLPNTRKCCVECRLYCHNLGVTTDGVLDNWIY
jgi:hypothetical protein